MVDYLISLGGGAEEYRYLWLSLLYDTRNGSVRFR